MKIIQITSHSYVNVDGDSFTLIYGLGEDNCVYRWINSEWVILN